MADPKTALLSIKTDAEPNFVRIDGKSYDILGYDDMVLLDRRYLGVLGARLQPLLDAYQQKKLAKKDEATFDDVLDKFCRRVLDAPAAVQKKLKRAHRIDLALVFMMLSLPRLREAGAAINGTNLRKGKRTPFRRMSSTPPRASHASTAAASSTG